LTELKVSAVISVMTEITAKHAIDGNPAPLAPAIERFVLHWGDMGGQWGVNRSISQIHALLYLSERPLMAEEIAETLGLARSNVSNSLKELLSWNLIRRVPVRGDRREHFEAETDVWEMFIRIAAGRKEREIDPAIAALKFCLSAADGDPKVHPVARKRLKDMLDFVATMEMWHTQMLTVPKSKLAALIRLGARIVNLLPGGKAR
jgi:DNA-binding transcriptional regulator GbsR (MarR family)